MAMVENAHTAVEVETPRQLEWWADHQKKNARTARREQPHSVAIDNQGMSFVLPASEEKKVVALKVRHVAQH